MLFEEGGRPRAQEMHALAVARTDPSVRQELTGRAPAAATTTGRRLSDLISGDTLPRPHELYDLVLALARERPDRDAMRRWLDDLEVARTASVPAPVERPLTEPQPAGLHTATPPAVEPVRPRGRRWLPVLAGAVVFVGGGTAAGLALTGTSHAHPTTTVEVSGGNAHTWSDYRIAGGEPGTALVTGQRVLVICRVQGFRVDDGNVWWYRLGESYGGRFYATADAFYNGAVPANGSLKGTPFVDEDVPVC